MANVYLALNDIITKQKKIRPRIPGRKAVGRKVGERLGNNKKNNISFGRKKYFLKV